MAAMPSIVSFIIKSPWLGQTNNTTARCRLKHFCSVINNRNVVEQVIGHSEESFDNLSMLRNALYRSGREDLSRSRNPRYIQREDQSINNPGSLVESSVPEVLACVVTHKQ